MTRGIRTIIFAITFILLLIVFYFSTGDFFPKSSINVILFSALLMLSFVTLFLEHYFTSPTDVLASTIAILLLISPLKDHLSNYGIWYIIFWFYNALLLFIALLSLLLLDDNKSSSSLQNRTSFYLKQLATYFGNGKLLFFLLFILTMLFYIDSQSPSFLILFGYATVILLINPKKYLLSLRKASSDKQNDIGEIFRVLSKNVFLAKLYESIESVHKFDFVEFNYAFDDEGKYHKGLIIDTYFLNQEQWVKILSTRQMKQILGDESQNNNINSNVVYKLKAVNAPDFLAKFIGTIIEGSSIGKIRFEYNSKADISEGDLLQLSIGNKTVLYQIIQGHTTVEKLESKNEAGCIVGEAVQIGIWNNQLRSFEKFGWVPDINTPVFLASDIEPTTTVKGEYIIGTLSNTNYPVIINMADAISHHLAILGITGSGKSVFARNLIRQIMLDGTKLICVDFTNEYKNKFNDIPISSIINEPNATEMFDAIDVLSLELAKFKNQQDKTLIDEKQNLIKSKFYNSIKEFLESNQSITLFELPDVSNTTGILEYTKWFFKVLFDIARKENNFDKKICIVLEEAHTVIPEWNFIGISEKEASSLVNSIGQIALQGRKYNIGFIIVAQRTANVSKTILTQCNSIIAFKQFDRTSSEFLANYMGIDMVAALPNLQPRQSIAVGKGFRAGIPMIVQIPEIKEP